MRISTRYLQFLSTFLGETINPVSSKIVTWDSSPVAFLGNVDATGTEPVPTAKTFRFGPFFDYWESEISVLVRNSINQAGDDLVVSDTLVTRDHNNRRQRIIGVECFAGLYDQGFDAFL